MFKCQSCGSCEFQLAVRPDYKGKLEININEHDDVMIITDSRTFLADLMFMNQFAVCHCGLTKTWTYFYPGLNEQEAAAAETLQEEPEEIR